MKRKWLIKSYNKKYKKSQVEQDLRRKYCKRKETSDPKLRRENMQYVNTETK